MNMKKLNYLIGIVFTIAIMMAGCQKTTLNELGSSPELSMKKNGCATIQSGTILYAAGHYLAGQPLTTGYDVFGYNYQAHMYNGNYANIYLGRDGYPPYNGDDVAYLNANPGAANKWYWPYRKDNVLMKWNEGWLSNKDCDKDGKLDRHYGYPAYIGSGAWLTNHISGSYFDESGTECNWNEFIKIIAVPTTATNTGGIWYNADGTEIGPAIWGQFAIIQDVINDPCDGTNGIQYRSPDHPGFGGW
jgi:hypothetical protein